MENKGVLLPVSCVGGFGKDAYKFIDYLANWHQKYWQVLPICPRDILGSPYNSPASMEIDSKYGTKKDWLALKKYANSNGVSIIGDLAFFINKRSKEYFENKELFLNDQFSGVPPDAYSPRTGQFWGQHQYNWEKLEETNFKFFLDRFRNVLELYDLVRLDHFRGYDAVWSIPAHRKTARVGAWVKVPGDKLFNVAAKQLGKLPFIAEDLGMIFPEVERLRKKLGFLGTNVVQFGKTTQKDVVSYTSTHDSPTLVGLVGKAEAKNLIAWVRDSNAAIKMITVADLLLLDNKARFNRPGTTKGNWRWKLDINLLKTINPKKDAWF